MVCPRFEMDVSDKRIITADFSEWLGDSDIDSADWTLPSGLTESNDSIDATLKKATNYFEATGEDEYTVKVTITTLDTVVRRKSYSFQMQVQSNCLC